jgi:hypothetical protein
MSISDKELQNPKPFQIFFEAKLKCTEFICLHWFTKLGTIEFF